MPKLLPTVPVQVQVSPALVVQFAVAGCPTLRHVILAVATDARRSIRAMGPAIVGDKSKVKTYTVERRGRGVSDRNELCEGFI